MTDYNRNGLNTNINVKREHKQQYQHKHEQKICVFTTKVDPKKSNKLNETIPQIGIGQTTALDFMPGNHN
jgi:hypothetical protein